MVMAIGNRKDAFSNMAYGRQIGFGNGVIRVRMADKHLGDL